MILKDISGLFSSFLDERELSDETKQSGHSAEILTRKMIKCFKKRYTQIANRPVFYLFLRILIFTKKKKHKKKMMKKKSDHRNESGTKPSTQGLRESIDIYAFEQI